MPSQHPAAATRLDLARDSTAGLVVFLVALPLCLGIALASNAPLVSGIVTGVIGGIVVGLASGSHTSVSGPAAGLTAVVAAAIAAIGSFEGFLCAVMLAGALQVALGLLHGGTIAAFVPGSVIKGLLAAIGLLLILKQIPHLLGHDTDADGEMSFRQPDQENTFTELWRTVGDLHPGAAVIGVVSLALLLAWSHTPLRSLRVPAPLAVAVLAVAMERLFAQLGAPWLLEPSHRVQVPVTQSLADLGKLVQLPDFAQLTRPVVLQTAVVLALVASLETLLNLEAIDRLDPYKRNSPPNRELVAQGFGNLLAGLAGGLPMTAVIVRGSVNIDAGARSKAAAVIHGVLLLGCVLLIPGLLNLGPLAALAAILIASGIKLASPKVFTKLWHDGPSQFVPFAATVAGILFTDLLVGVLIGLATAVVFILKGSMRSPLRRVIEQHIAGNVLRIELASHVSFLNRGALQRTLDSVPAGSHVLLDARHTEYIDPDVLQLLHEFRSEQAPARDVHVSMVGFQAQYELRDEVQYVDFTSREVQSNLTPARVLSILAEGNRRFRSGHRLTRDFGRQVDATAQGQFPMAVVLSCIDSRSPVEFLFDLGLGDTFVIRIAGNVAKEKVLGSMEYGCLVAGAKLVVVMGHTRCGAVNAAVDLFEGGRSAAEATGCEHLDALVMEIQRAIAPGSKPSGPQVTAEQRTAFADAVARQNVIRTIGYIRSSSQSLEQLREAGRIDIVGAMYDIRTGEVEFFDHAGRPLQPA